MDKAEHACTLESDGQCCCQCKFQWIDYHHCTIHSELRAKENKCVCSIPKGFVCVGFMHQGDGSTGVHSEWPEHSIGCEMYIPRNGATGA
jgi:hypothetical protein